MNMAGLVLTAPLLTDENSDKFLLKPTKSLMTAACCGHQWLNSERKSPTGLEFKRIIAGKPAKLAELC